MLKIFEDIDLKNYTSFKIGGRAKFFTELNDLSEIKYLQELNKYYKNIFILGKGSNILISDSGYNGLVIHINIKGFEIYDEDNDFILLKVNAGEDLDDIVKFCVQKNLWGIENLSYIPSSIGAFVVQNVGAYGQEAADVIEKVEVYDRVKNQIKIFYNKDCGFGYRTSIFNTKYKDRFIILNVYLKLKKSPSPNLEYADLKKIFFNKKADIKEIRQAIIKIRQAKLPNPKKIGNAGSFFKNLFLTDKQLFFIEKHLYTNFAQQENIDKFKKICLRLKNKKVKKFPTAFLIDLLGLKNFCIGNACIYEKHSLIIVNKNGLATADEVLQLFKYIRILLWKNFNVIVENEPVLLGFSEKELKYYFSLQF